MAHARLEVLVDRVLLRAREVGLRRAELAPQQRRVPRVVAVDCALLRERAVGGAELATQQRRLARVLAPQER